VTGDGNGYGTWLSLDVTRKLDCSCHCRGGHSQEILDVRAPRRGCLGLQERKRECGNGRSEDRWIVKTEYHLDLHPDNGDKETQQRRDPRAGLPAEYISIGTGISHSESVR
jgi:hypothetical protein